MNNSVLKKGTVLQVTILTAMCDHEICTEVYSFPGKD
jgi:hypothetical protein